MIFLSSHDTQMDIVMTMNMGGDDYIQKPFHMDVLIAKINALLRRTYSYMETQSQTMEHDGIILNLENGEVLHGDRKSELTKTEFLILKILFRSEEHTSELQSRGHLVCRLLLENKKKSKLYYITIST